MSQIRDAYICLGSNCAESVEKLRMARQEIAALPEVETLESSGIYFTEPQDYQDQPWFANQVLACQVGSYILPGDFLQKLLAIETGMGRKRTGPRFGPRIIDIDLLMFGNFSQSDPDCILPHPRMHRRAFVLVPLLEIAPDIKINGQPASELLAVLYWRQDGKKIFQNGFLSSESS